ncbi:hypothetical protein ACQ4PT_005968 [Festuca glaucescens]
MNFLMNFSTFIWNIQGFGQDGRRRQLKEYMRQVNADIVGIQETTKQSFLLAELQGLSQHKFAWHWLPASGHSGGILLGVKEDTFEVEDMEQGEFYVSMRLIHRQSNLQWEIVIVYGLADHSRTPAFLAELAAKIDRSPVPMVVAGNFNLIRTPDNKSSPTVDIPRMRMFNDCIADLALREITRVGARFTWTNKQVDLIQSVLDRVFVSAEWEVAFPLCSLRALTRIGSDHVPLLFALGGGQPPKLNRFHFEKSWLSQPGLVETIRQKWLDVASTPQRFFNAVDVWRQCAKMARQFMRGWGANLGASLRLQKSSILGEIQALDHLADSVGLSPQEWSHRYSLEDSLMEIYKGEESFWRQRSRQNWILQGDANTAYFHAIANGRRRKCSIPCLWEGERLLENNKDISSHVYSFYKDLFSAGPHSGVALSEDFWPALARVSAEENASLTLPFLPEEVAHAVKEMKANSAPGPDGLPVSFFQTFWDRIQPVLQRRGLDERFITWIMQFVMSGSSAININVEVGSYFRPSCGVRQGDPISPLLFNTAVDALAEILDKARTAGHISGMVGHLIPGGGITHLQYADDTLIMVEGSELDIQNLKFLLLCFEEMSGLRINFDKSEVVVLGYPPKEQQRIADNLNCRLASFPITYLGMPIRDSRILIKDLAPLVGRVRMKAEPWRARFTSKGSKSVLIDSCLSSLPMYIMGLCLLPEGVHGDFDMELSRFFWQDTNGRQKYHMVKWADICVPKDQGGHWHPGL